MKIVCSKSLTRGEEAFASIADVVVIPESEISAEHVCDADALVTRSKIKISRALVEKSGLHFYGTATAGFDHVDLQALEDFDIHFAHAPGCNARGVGEYVCAALLELAVEHHFDLESLTLGIIGHGNTGHQVEAKAKALGMKVLLNDPPRKDAGETEPYISLDEFLQKADVVSLHVPLVKEGPHPTEHLIDECSIAKIKKGAILVNACRGEVLDSNAACDALDSGRLAHAVIDVWAPGVHVGLMERAALVSPHVAGHSFEGKINGTIQLYQKLCAYFNLEEKWDYEPYRKSIVQEIAFSSPSTATLYDLRQLVRSCYDIREDDQLFRKAMALDAAERMVLFKSLREDYRTRNEFHRTEIHSPITSPFLKNKLGALGFSVR